MRSPYGFGPTTLPGASELKLGRPFEVAAQGSPIQHLADLAACRALVISRSTFSWWAAVIASGGGAPVVYPTPWR